MTDRFNLSIDIFSPVDAALEATPLAMDSYDVLPPITGLWSEFMFNFFFSRICATAASLASFMLVTGVDAIAAPPAV